MAEEWDVVVVGAGLVGLATAMSLLKHSRGLSVVVIDKEPSVGLHQSSHNSGVLHSGLYYQPGSLKALLCVEGKRLLEAFAHEHGIATERCGKLVIAVSEDELPRLSELRRRGELNGVEGLREVGPTEMAEIEPHSVGMRGLHVSSTAIVDFAVVARTYAQEVERLGGVVLLNRRLTGVIRRETCAVVETGAGPLTARLLVTCAGLQSDRCARMTQPSGVHIVPFRGDFYTLAPSAAGLVRGLIYPVPDPSLPFLGPHLTRRIDGEVWAGPNAVLALAREGYRRSSFHARDLGDTLGFPGFWRMARRHWRTGVGELWRDVAKRSYLRQLQRYVPDLRAADLTFGPSGVRAQAVARDGSLVDDFVLQEGVGMLHVVNAPSPAATASLAIGRRVAELAMQRLAV